MSVTLMGKVFGLDIEPSEKLLLLAMADLANDDGSDCWPSVKYLVWKTSLSERHVRRMLSSLREKGVLIVDCREGGGRRCSVVYQIDLGPLSAKPPFPRDGRGRVPPDYSQRRKERKREKFRGAENPDTIAPFAGEKIATLRPL